MKKIFLFYGFGAEYVLHPIYEEMQKQGLHCIEIDALAIPNSQKEIDNLKGRDIIFITSAHFLLNETNFKHFYPTDNHFYGTLEIISLLKPKASIFVPHDLTQPIIDYEKEYLNQFTVFCSPCQPFTDTYAHYTKTIEMGWIKYNAKLKMIVPKNKAIWFLSDFILHLNWGVEKSYNLIQSILTQGVSIKFPRWPGSEEFEDYFSKKGIHVYPSDTNSTDLITVHDIILTNGLSSLIAESYFLGKTTINIVEASHYGDGRTYLQTLFPHLQFIEKIKQFNLRTIDIKKRPSVLQPFKMENMIQFLTAL